MTFFKFSHFEEVGEAYASDPRLRNLIVKKRYTTQYPYQQKSQSPIQLSIFAKNQPIIILKRTNSSNNHFPELTACLDKDLQNLYGSTQEEFDQKRKFLIMETTLIFVKTFYCNIFRHDF
jgi:hypothetical protein